MSSHYAELCRLHKEAATLASVNSLLNWDQETYMPAGGSEARSDQQSLLSGLIHERRTSRRLGELISACEADAALTADPRTAANVREMRRDYDLATKLPTDLVAELARVTSLSQDAWKAAREKSDFASFAPWLEKVLDLTRRKAECYGFRKGGELYDALLDEYEPDMTAREVDSIFNPLRTRLAGLVAQIAKSPRQPNSRLLQLKAEQREQHAFGLTVLGAMGFDLTAGRLDTTAHPFCSGLAPGDTRLTTRYTTDSFLEPLYGTMHEAGHGLYEQGLPKHSHFGEPLGDSISLGIHESQSRMWENFVGRSRAFWQWALPIAKSHLSPIPADVSLDEVYAAANLVEPSYIRVEADEATYNLHIMLRFQIERAMVNGQLAVKDLPATWNKLFTEFFGLAVPDDRRGCLQDVHWSFGLIGYFPTYTLGNLYAAQFWEKINTDITDLSAQMSVGRFGALKSWLNTNVHAHGRQFSAAKLCERITGKPLTADPLMRHLEGKLRPIYGI